MACKPKPLTQAKYSLLTPISFVVNKGWLCQCDCGNKTVVDANKLRTHKVKSCGCFRKTNGSNAVLRAQEKNRVLTKAGQPFGWARHHAMGERRVIRAPFMIGHRSGGAKPCWCCRVLREGRCYARGVLQVNKNQRRTKWLDELYPEIKRGPHSSVRIKQRTAFLVGYDLAIRDMKHKLWEKVMEEVE